MAWDVDSSDDAISPLALDSNPEVVGAGCGGLDLLMSRVWLGGERSALLLCRGLAVTMGLCARSVRLALG